MMYFKQAWNLIKQEKLFSSIYIIGTGLSIAVVMLLSIVFYIKVGNIYPESNRDRTLIMGSAMTTSQGEYPRFSCGGLSYQAVEQCLYNLESAEAVSAIHYSFAMEYHILPEGDLEQLPVRVKWVDTQFWKVFPFRFINGKPFSEEDMQSGVRTAVISETLAKRLFGTKEAGGSFLTLNSESYRVCGVVKDAPAAMEVTYADLWVPYTVDPEYIKPFSPDGAIGSLSVYILAPSQYKMEEVREEILGNLQRYASQLKDVEFTTLGQPDRQWQSIFRTSCNNPIDFGRVIRQYSIILVVFLLIPAISLSGMTDSRMERRLAEMGVRRAFGAPSRSLMKQVLTENFLFTVLGGLLGVLLSYLLFYMTRDWIMQAGNMHYFHRNEFYGSRFSFSMFVNPVIFLVTLAVCFVLNFLSAFIPAWKASHKPIVYSIHHVKQ